jgi:hypothetical protein
MIEIAHNFGANIHINKYHAISLNVIREKFEIFWEIALCGNYFVAQA